MDVNDLGIHIGSLPHGALNSISDVPGVRVGHVTIDTERSKTGVTVVIPGEGNPFTHKLPAASFVLNGFGKTLGLVQIDELGTLETPIALTNTLNVGIVHDALVEYMLTLCDQDGVSLTSVNPVVCECNDASLNDIRLRTVKKEHVLSAIQNAGCHFMLGDVGAGKGMTCHGLKGGIGTSSRIIRFGNTDYTLGVLMLTNHGSLNDLTIDGKKVGSEINRKLLEDQPDKGSCIAVVATDLPLSSRQIRRVLKRAAVGLCRLGSHLGHGSGDIFVGFSTANRLTDTDEPFRKAVYLNENCIDTVFRACAEAVEEGVLRSMLKANTVTGYSGKVRRSLSEYLNDKRFRSFFD